MKCRDDDLHPNAENHDAAVPGISPAQRCFDQGTGRHSIAFRAFQQEALQSNPTLLAAAQSTVPCWTLQSSQATARRSWCFGSRDCVAR
jgi:hypothetical protein